MLQINSLTDDPFQQFILDGIPGIQISCLLVFRPRVNQWFIDVTSGTFTAQGLAVVCTPNLLRQWKNLISFGLAITNANYLDPYSLTDFSSGNSSLFLLNSADVANIEQEYFTAPATAEY